MSELEPGTVLHGRYTVRGLLARGGMSVLYHALDSHLPGAWVIKQMQELPGNPGDLESIRDQFRREAAILSGLSHKGLPRVIDCFREDGRDYLVEELIDGESLEELLAQRKKLGEYEAIEIALELLDVLEYLHGKGIVYRDLKPGNVMLDRNGSVRLVDFGIARLFTAGKSADTVVVGTPGFASPEHYGRGQTDVRSDLYSLGATLHAIVTGVDPADSPFSFEPPCAAAPGTSTGFSRVVMRSLELSPAQRFSSAAEMRDALRTCMRERPGRKEYRYGRFIPVRGALTTGGTWGVLAGAFISAPLMMSAEAFLLIPLWLAGLGAASFVKGLLNRGFRLEIGDDGLVCAAGGSARSVRWEEITALKVLRTSGMDRTLWGAVSVFPSRIEVHAGQWILSFTPELPDWQLLVEWIIYRAGLEPLKDVEEKGADQVYRRQEGASAPHFGESSSRGPLRL